MSGLQLLDEVRGRDVGGEADEEGGVGMAIELEEAVNPELVELLHMAIVARKLMWNCVSQMEQLIDSCAVATPELQAAMKRLDEAVDTLASDVEAGKVYTVTLEDLFRWMEEPAAADADLERFQRAVRAIKGCTLTGVDFGDYVQSVCEDLLAGEWPECWRCETAVHDGPCVGDGDGSRTV